jgi:hypothetical protein
MYRFCQNSLGVTMEQSPRGSATTSPGDWQMVGGSVGEFLIPENRSESFQRFVLRHLDETIDYRHDRAEDPRKRHVALPGRRAAVGQGPDRENEIAGAVDLTRKRVVARQCLTGDSIFARRAARAAYDAFTWSRYSSGTYFTAAVRSSLSQANLRPSSARVRVLNSTTENSWR